MFGKDRYMKPDKINKYYKIIVVLILVFTMITSMGNIYYSDFVYAATKTGTKIEKKTSKKVAPSSKKTVKKKQPVKTPSKVKNLVVKKSSATKIKLTWSKTKNAKKYEVYCGKDDCFNEIKWKKIKTVTSNTCKIRQNQTEICYYKVRGVNGTKKGTFSAIVSIKLPVTYYEEIDLPDFGAMYSCENYYHLYDPDDDYLQFEYKYAWDSYDQIAASFFDSYVKALTTDFGWKLVEDPCGYSYGITTLYGEGREEVVDNKYSVVKKNGYTIVISVWEYPEDSILVIELYEKD